MDRTIHVVLSARQGVHRPPYFRLTQKATVSWIVILSHPIINAIPVLITLGPPQLLSPHPRRHPPDINKAFCSLMIELVLSTVGGQVSVIERMA